jgi:hypothetical protein
MTNGIASVVIYCDSAQGSLKIASWVSSSFEALPIGSESPNLISILLHVDISLLSDGRLSFKNMSLSVCYAIKYS